VFEGVHSKEVDRRISWEKLNKFKIKRGVNELLKQLQDTGTFDKRPAGRFRPRSEKKISKSLRMLNISNILLTHKRT